MCGKRINSSESFRLFNFWAINYSLGLGFQWISTAEHENVQVVCLCVVCPVLELLLHFSKDGNCPQLCELLCRINFERH